MVMKMNKSNFIKKLQEETGYSQEQCITINNILEAHCIVGKRNKQKIIDDLISNYFTEDDAENIYDISMKIIMNEVKDKVKAPFGKLFGGRK